MNKIHEKKYDLTWSLNDNEYGRRSIWHPSIEQIYSKLDMLGEQGTGEVTLSLNDHTQESKTLWLRGQLGNYIITFFDLLDGKTIYRRIFDPTLPAEMVELPDEDWDRQAIFKDFKIVYPLFKEFFETQNIASGRIE